MCLCFKLMTKNGICLLMSAILEGQTKKPSISKGIWLNPYPHKFPVSMPITEFIEKYRNLSIGEHLESTEISLAGTHCINWFNPLNLFQKAHMCFFLNEFAGRIMNKRASSSKLFFYDLYGDGMKIQVMADARYHMFCIPTVCVEDETKN